MTHTEEQLTALRIKIAEKMGWNSGAYYNPNAPEVDCVPSYITDANAALLLVEHMRKEGWSFNAHAGRNGSIFKVTFEAWARQGQLAVKSSETIPLAIALAFAEANGIEI